MAQHDYVIANGTGAAVRSDLNNALAAIVSQNSGPVAPTTTYAYMPWADTGSSPPVFKIRNAANNGWITLYELDGTFSIEAGSASSPGLYFTGDTNTGIYSPGADQFGISTGGTSRLVIDASGNINMDSGTVYVDAANNRLGIGTTSPAQKLDVNGAIRLLSSSSDFNTESGQFDFDSSSGATRISSYKSTGSSVQFFTNASSGTVNERARIDSSGRLLVGTSSARGNFFRPFSATAAVQIEGTSGNLSTLSVVRNSNDSSPSYFVLGKSRGTANASNTIVQSGDTIGGISFQGTDGGDLTEAARISAEVDGTPGTADMPGRLVFSTTADGASSPTERMRITSGGIHRVTQSGSYNESTNLAGHYFQNDNNTGNGFVSWNNSFSSTVVSAVCLRSANSDYSFYYAASGNGSTAYADTEFKLRGDGNGLCDGSWTGGGADYAEYFEWSDGNPDEDDRRGISVVLDGDKIRPATDGQEPIGVISGNPSVVGDSAWNKWSGKYLRDDYGTYIQEDYEVVNDEGETVVQQRRKLNPAYDPDQQYVNREQRPEWDCVGLMGKLRIRKGQPTGSRWIKMRDISDSVEEWLVR